MTTPTDGLPEPDVTSYQLDSTMRKHELRTYSSRLCAKIRAEAIRNLKGEHEVSTGAPMLCNHCGRPCASGIWIGAGFYHEECTHGPSWARTYFTAPPMTEEDVRRIVREELNRGGQP